MFSENLGAVPGRVLYDQLTTWLDGASSGAFLFNASEDVLYEHKGGKYVLPELPEPIQRAIVRGEAELLIGTCVVYGSISRSDLRRWEVRALYAFSPGSDVPEAKYVHELDIDESVTKCDSGTIRSEWMQARANRK